MTHSYRRERRHPGGASRRASHRGRLGRGWRGLATVGVVYALHARCGCGHSDRDPGGDGAADDRSELEERISPQQGQPGAAPALVPCHPTSPSRYLASSPGSLSAGRAGLRMKRPLEGTLIFKVKPCGCELIWTEDADSPRRSYGLRFRSELFVLVPVQSSNPAPAALRNLRALCFGCAISLSPPQHPS